MFSSYGSMQVSHVDVSSVHTCNKKNVGNRSEEHSGYGWNFIERQKGTFTRVNRYLVTSVQMLLSLWMSSSTCGLEEEE